MSLLKKEEVGDDEIIWKNAKGDAVALWWKNIAHRRPNDVDRFAESLAENAYRRGYFDAIEMVESNRKKRQ